MNFLFDALWPGLAIWGLLFISDYSLTIKCARLRRRPGGEKLRIEGSYELTPYFQKDIDSLRAVSPRFILILLLNCSLLTVIWFTSHESTPKLYEFVLGVLILLQLTIHMRHLQNLVMFRTMTTSEVTGSIEYSRRLVLRMSAYEGFRFAALYLILFGVTERWFVLGGAVARVAFGVKHLRLSRKFVPAAATQANAVST